MILESVLKVSTSREEGVFPSLAQEDRENVRSTLRAPRLGRGSSTLARYSFEGVMR